PSDKRCAAVGGKPTANSDWPVLFGLSSSGEHECLDCLTRRLLLPPTLRLLAARSTQLVVLALAIPGANRFSGALLPPLPSQERRVQKNETHPCPLWLFYIMVYCSHIIN